MEALELCWSREAMGELLRGGQVEEACTFLKAALGNDDRKMADLSLTLGCYGAVSTLLNMFEVPVPTGEPLPFPAQ